MKNQKEDILGAIVIGLIRTYFIVCCVLLIVPILCMGVKGIISKPIMVISIIILCFCIYKFLVKPIITSVIAPRKFYKDMLKMIELFKNIDERIESLLNSNPTESELEELKEMCKLQDSYTKDLRYRYNAFSSLALKMYRKIVYRNPYDIDCISEIFERHYMSEYESLTSARGVYMGMLKAIKLSKEIDNDIDAALGSKPDESELEGLKEMCKLLDSNTEDLKCRYSRFSSETCKMYRSIVSKNPYDIDCISEIFERHYMSEYEGLIFSRGFYMDTLKMIELFKSIDEHIDSLLGSKHIEDMTTAIFDRFNKLEEPCDFNSYDIITVWKLIFKSDFKCLKEMCKLQDSYIEDLKLRYKIFSPEVLKMYHKIVSNYPYDIDNVSELFEVNFMYEYESLVTSIYVYVLYKLSKGFESYINTLKVGVFSGGFKSILNFYNKFVYSKAVICNKYVSLIQPDYLKRALHYLGQFGDIHTDYEELKNISSCNYTSWAYAVLLYRYIESDEYKKIKTAVENSINEANELNAYIASVSNGVRFIKNGNLNAGMIYAYSGIKGYAGLFSKLENIYYCSDYVLQNASMNPFKYICKYFDVPVCEDTLKLCEDFIQMYEVVKDGELSYYTKVAELDKIIEAAVPEELDANRAELKEKLGLRVINIKKPVFPVCEFRTKTKSGDIERSFKFEFNIDTMNAFAQYIGDSLALKRSAKYQRALMTSSLRKEILKRDNYTCKYCGNSTYNEPNLLLEIDHIKPLSKGGLTVRENLQTLCWRCNRSKSNKEES